MRRLALLAIVFVLGIGVGTVLPQGERGRPGREAPPPPPPAVAPAPLLPIPEDLTAEEKQLMPGAGPGPAGAPGR